MGVAQLLSLHWQRLRVGFHQLLKLLWALAKQICAI